jgi:hypothetical protein
LGNRVAKPVECEGAVRLLAAVGGGKSDPSSLWSILTGAGSSPLAPGTSSNRKSRTCPDLLLPGDFDVAQISWRQDYDPFFYRQLDRRARRTYLFRDEYIFDVEKAVVVETPQLGHATYVFAKPRSMDSFLALYTKISKDDVCQNRNNAAECLGFLGRVIHGRNPRAWLKEVRGRIGERMDFPDANAE